ncbi:anthranilate phosphoribosyltransferase [candidate division KSB1 bacterium]|nr:anthranilate phosphoribosyltransferase [candidate division KSB1 bacterium]
MIQQAIQKATQRVDLQREEAFAVMTEIMSGAATPAQIGALLTAMRMKGERTQEIVGFAEAMRRQAVAVTTKQQNVIDLSGTGHDGKETFNISTVAAFVVAGAGVPVAKSVNCAVTTRCGSAEVLQALGINVDLTPQQMGRCLDEVGLAFLFAPALYPHMQAALVWRSEIGMRTIFNVLGPLTNPAGVRRQVLGVGDRRLATILAEALAEMGVEQALLVHGDEGLDEISVHGRSLTVELLKGRISERTLTPEDFGLHRYTNGLYGGTPPKNAEIARRILQGEAGAPRDVVIANAACGLWVAGLADNFKAGAALATQSLDSGAAMQKLEALRVLTNSFEKN